jgi:crotonobetainyl-CoA:carnitine CoA-transferase CaiB-like acyl-CoA transferase
MSKLPLEGVRVLDLSQVWAGPACTSILASLGAYVIKVEGLTRGDISHSILPVDNDPGDDPWNSGPYYFCHNAGKRSITLQLTEEEGVKLFKRLIPSCDVLIENFAPRVMRNFGLGYDVLREIRPDLIMISMSGYGQTGPYRGYGAYGMGLESAAGIASVTGYPGGRPMRSGVSFTDPVAGIAAAGAVLLALRHRERTGRGQFIDMSQQEAAIPFLGAALMEYQMTGRVPGPRGNRSTAAAPQGCYRCRGDDDWLVISVGGDGEWARFCDAAEHPEWRGDERFATVPARHENHDALDSLVEGWTRDQDHIEAFHLLQRAGVKAAPVLNGKEMLLDPHLRERGHFDVIDHGRFGPRPIPRHLVAKFDRMDPKPDGPAPALGEHNAEVLQELAGLSAGEAAEMEARQVIGTTRVLAVAPQVMRGMLKYPLELMVEQGALRAVEADYLDQLGLSGGSASDAEGKTG